MGRIEAANAANDAINRWHPGKILLVGIAGGIGSANVQRGDILIADQIVDYELQKLSSSPSQPRWKTLPVDPQLLEAAKHVPDNWRDKLQLEPPTPVIPSKLIGAMATGDKIIADENIQTDLLAVWLKLIGIEMEAGGVASAAEQSARRPGFFMIRGVSDLANATKDDAWHTYACHVAATFTLALLESGPLPFTEHS
jgi:nucleoside phosphorylase